jgi:L-asparaginase type II
MNEFPRIHLLVGRGTLPSRGRDRMDFTNYRRSGRPRMTAQELLSEIPEIARFARVEPEGGTPYETGTLEDVRKLAERVNALVRSPDVDGVVFVQGTNTLEETAYFLTLTVRTTKPVVVTGAQRPFTAMSSDAPLNLFDAIRVAACPDSHRKGVVVATNGEINSARDVTKTNTYHVQTFRSRDVGVLGYADADRIVYYRAPTRRHTFESEFQFDKIARLPHVEVLYPFTGTRAGLARAAVELGARGLVLAGVGAGALGNLTEECTAIAAAGRAVIVRSARVGEGRVIRDSGYHEPGMVAADNLSPQKAGVLLSLALTLTGDPEEIQRMFDEY